MSLTHPRSVARSVAALSLLALSLMGCRAAGSAAASTMSGVVGGVVTPAVDLMSGVAAAATPSREVDVMEQQREAMAMRAGPGKFQHPEMTEYRDRVQFRQASLRTSPFREQRDQFSHPAMARFQTHVNRGTVPVDPLPTPIVGNGSIKSRLGLPVINLVVRQLGFPDPIGLPIALPSFAE